MKQWFIEKKIFIKNYTLTKYIFIVFVINLDIEIVKH